MNDYFHSEVRDYRLTIAHCTGRLLRLGGVDQLVEQVTIGILPDDALLKIFKFFVDAMELYRTESDTSDEWHTLVHVCRRWRYLAFSSPRHLNLQLLCKIPQRSVEEMLDIWPELPIYVSAIGYLVTKKERDNCIAALQLNHRVSGIRLRATAISAWETLAPLMYQPFPALTHLSIEPDILISPISPSFLGGSAPFLQVLRLIRVPFPELPELLLSATDLDHLSYEVIPSSGYISSQEMVTGLSALTQLKSLYLTFLPFRDLSDKAIRIPPPHTRALLPALTNLHFRGVSEYMEDLAAQTDASLLEKFEITFFHQEILEVSELAKFIRRADKLSLVDRAQVVYVTDSISVRLSEILSGIKPKTLEIHLICPHSQFRLSHLVQLCASCFPTPSIFECLLINVQRHSWDEFIFDPDPQWLELLCLFSNVKQLRLVKAVAHPIAQALGELPAERVLRVLPALEIVFMAKLEPVGPVKEAISKFTDARQLSGHPVSIRWGGGIRRWR